MTALGVIARCENRGLGIQSLEVVRHLKPDVVLLVMPSQQRWPTHPEWYDGHQVIETTWDVDGTVYGGQGLIDRGDLKRFCRDVDVIWSAETLYDWRLPDIARSKSTRCVVHVNPEMLHPRHWHADNVVWWSATPWMRHEGVKVIPHPAPVDRFPIKARVGDRVRMLHVAGHRAVFDRNGTDTLCDALRKVNGPCDVTLTGQDGQLPAPRRGPQMAFRGAPNGVEDYWQLYADQDVLLMPRRFGGLCLPVIEAAAAGLAVLMPDIAPNEMWPGPRFPVAGLPRKHTVGCEAPVADLDPQVLANAINELTDPEVVSEWQAQSREWSISNSWDALEDLWRQELTAASR